MIYILFFPLNYIILFILSIYFFCPTLVGDDVPLYLVWVSDPDMLNVSVSETNATSENDTIVYEVCSYLFID